MDGLGSLSTSATPSKTTTFRRLGAALTNIDSILEADGKIDGGTSTVRGTGSRRFSVATSPSRRYNAPLPIPVNAALGHSVSCGEPNFHMPFEDELARSWVYARVRRNECDISFTSQQPSSFWSMLSNLSLSQIFNISVIALPLTLKDVSNSSWYNVSTRKNPGLVGLDQPGEAEDNSQVDVYHDISVLGECDVGKSTVVTKVRPKSTNRLPMTMISNIISSNSAKVTQTNLKRILYLDSVIMHPSILTA